MSRTPRNMVVAQSGGPSPVINNSLRGIIEQGFAKPIITELYHLADGAEAALLALKQALEHPVA